MNIVVERYRELPQNIRMILTAIIGAGIGYITYEIIYIINPITPKPSSSWFISYIIGIARQHALHRYLTFDSSTEYWRSLGRAYIMYSGSLLIGVSTNYLLTNIFNIDHRFSWLICLIITASTSFILLKRFVFKKR